MSLILDEFWSEGLAMKKTKALKLWLLISAALLLNLFYYRENLWTIWAKYYIRDQDIVISFTTTPHRIKFLERTLLCLSRQNAQIRQIYLSIPSVFKRDGLEYQIPDWLEDYPNVTILRTEDYGPATKILGTLKNAALSSDTIIIAVDDDTCYPNNFVLKLAVRAKMYPNEAIGVSGAEIDFDKNKEGGVVKVFKDNVHVTMLEGFGGIAYKRNFFTESIYNISNAPKACYNSDDLYISHHLAQNNIPRRTLNTTTLDVRKDIRQLQFGYNADALYKIDNSQAERYKQCLAYLHTKFPEVVFETNNKYYAITP